MSLLFESIRIEYGKAWNLAFHEERINKARSQLFGISEPLSLADITMGPANLSDQLYKCRVVYAQNFVSIEFVPYFFREINALRLVKADHLVYNHKFLDRSSIESLLNHKGNCNDILIIKNGLVTDVSMANIIFFDGRNWFTPAAPLLAGTKRAKLIKEGRIHEENIKPADIPLFKKAKIINAFFDIDDPFGIPVGNIVE